MIISDRLYYRIIADRLSNVNISDRLSTIRFHIVIITECGISPYSLRRAQNGNILLYAVRAEDGQIRAYKIDQINDASMTNRVFVPRYRIELSPSGNIQPITQSRGSGASLGIPQRTPRLPGIQHRTSSRRPSGFSNRPTYIYRCPVCDKTFRHKNQNPKLNPHKTKDGWPCPGRTGYYEDIIY